jgi:hypothetical protein
MAKLAKKNDWPWCKMDYFGDYDVPMTFFDKEALDQLKLKRVMGENRLPPPSRLFYYDQCRYFDEDKLRHIGTDNAGIQFFSLEQIERVLTPEEEANGVNKRPPIIPLSLMDFTRLREEISGFYHAVGKRGRRCFTFTEELSSTGKFGYIQAANVDMLLVEIKSLAEALKPAPPPTQPATQPVNNANQPILVSDSPPPRGPTSPRHKPTTPQCSPTSPQYNGPTSPQYNPTSPQYDHIDSQYGHTSSDDEAYHF